MLGVEVVCILGTFDFLSLGLLVQLELHFDITTMSRRCAAHRRSHLMSDKCLISCEDITL